MVFFWTLNASLFVHSPLLSLRTHPISLVPFGKLVRLDLAFLFSPRFFHLYTLVFVLTLLYFLHEVAAA